MKKILLNKKNWKVFGIASIITLIVLSSFSYAYFIGSIGGSASTDVDVTTSVNERLVFTEGLPININATLDNFSEGDGSLTGTTTTNVRLNAGSQSSTATEQYQVYYNIEVNNFEYSVDENTPELILTIIDPEGNILTSAELADGTILSSESVTTLVQDAEGNPTSQTVTGFDITTLEGLIFLAEDYEITNTNPTVATNQNWSAKITFINLDAEQTINEGKTLNSNFMLLEEGSPLNISILNDNGGKVAIEAKNTPDFSQIADTNEGMFAAQDDYGTSYYFRGAVDNNWVNFAGFYWKIMRINGDGSVRMVYSGTTQPTEVNKVRLSTESITATAYYSMYNLAEYAGYMFTEGEQHGSDISSTAKIAVDTWYENNILYTEYHSKISDNLFCVDRTSYTDPTGTTSASGTQRIEQYFGSYIRNVTNKKPDLECPDQRDAFTFNDTINGNGALKYPVGLLTADEFTLAGLGDSSSGNNYLFAGQDYWGLSPSYMTGSNTRVHYVTLTGRMLNNSLTYQYSLRYVISLNSSSFTTGSGTWNDPYVVI